MKLTTNNPVDLLPNLSNLYIGRRLHNYKDLCEKMYEQPKAANAKQAQINDWKRHFNFITEGHKIVITEIYAEPRAKTDGRSSGNNTIWLDKISLIFLDYLVREREEFNISTVYLTKTDILEIVGLCNEYYREGKVKDKLLIEKEGIDIIEYKDFFSKSSSAFNSIITRMLESLTKRYIITYIETYKVKLIGGKGNRECTEAEREEIQKIYGKVLDMLELKSRQEAYIRHKNVLFYKSVNALLKEIGIEEHYTIQKISFYSSIKERTENYRKSTDKSIATKVEVNKLSCKARHKEIVTSIDKYLKETVEEDKIKVAEMVKIVKLEGGKQFAPKIDFESVEDKEEKYQIRYTTGSKKNLVGLIKDYIEIAC